MEHERTGEAYCLADQVTLDDGKRLLMLASLRYLDTFVKMGRRVGVCGAAVPRLV